MLKPKPVPRAKFGALMQKFNGNKTLVAKDLRMGYTTLTEAIFKSEELGKLVIAQDEITINNVESRLHQRINGYGEKDLFIAHYKGEIIYKEIVKHYPPDPTCIIFFLKTRARSRGYVENVVNPGGKTVSEITFIAIEPSKEEPRTIDISPGEVD